MELLVHDLVTNEWYWQKLDSFLDEKKDTGDKSVSSVCLVEEEFDLDKVRKSYRK